MIARRKEHGSRVVTAVCLVLGICAVARAQSADSFNPGANAIVNTLAVQPDGKILVGGAFTMLGGGGNGTTPRNHLGRLAADGSLDASFNPGANGEVYGIAVQPDGKILVGGAFTMLGGGGTGTTSRNYLGRLNANGSLDTTFNPGANGSVFDVAVQADGKILITGGFHMLGGGGTGTTAREFLGRLNADGSLDTTFNPGMNYFAYAMAVQPDGKILLGGWFTMLGGGGSGTTPRNYIGRLNADGSLDESFDPGANNYVNTLAVQPDGKILAGGNFTTLGGGGIGTTTRNRLGRLNANGSLDASFNPGANDAVRALTLQADGKVVVVGSFTSLGGGTGTTTRHNLGRLNADGSLDTSFDPGANGFWVFGLAMQADGKVLAGGDFTLLGGGTPRAHLGRVASNSAAVQNIDITNGGSTITWSRSGAGPEVSSVTFESSADAATYSSLGNATRVAGGWQLSGLSLPAGQTLYIRARGYYATNGWFSGSGSILESIRSVYTSCSTIALSATVFANGTAGEAYPSTIITQTGGVGVTTFTVTNGALPGGMSLSSAGVVSGTPNAAGTFNATVTATDVNGCTGSRAYTVTVAPKCSSIASTGATFAAAGGSGSVAITAPAGCSWTVTNVPPWASTISGASGSGAGVWQYAVAANAGPLRSQTITAAGHEFELWQLAGSVTPYGAWVDLAWQPAGDVDYLIDKLVAAGVQNVRMAFRWYMFEPVKGQWSFGLHDQIVAKLRARGIEILGLIQHPPAWADGGGTPGISPPVNDADWQAFISQLATHYRGQVANWEIWNEENLFAFWSPVPDAVRYVQLLKIAFNTIRSADPGATVVLGGLGGNGTFMAGRPEERDYLQKIYDNGGKNYFDVLNVHIYVHPVTEGVSGLQGYLQDTHTVMAANGDAGKPLWLTETGWSLTPNSYTPNITETDLANLLTSIFRGRASLGLDRIYWFNFRDMPTDPDEFGMVRRDLTLRPSYFAYKNLTSSPPTITTQPQSQSIPSGHTATLSVAASGVEPFSYQWYVGASGTTTNPISGATGSSYTTPPLTNTTSYWVRVSNSNPPAADSATATMTMTVGTPPTITTGPQSQTIASGQTATLSVVATGTPPVTFQWYQGASSVTSAPIAGATASTFTTPALSTATGYWVRVLNAFGSTDSTAASIAIGAAPAITTQPLDQSILSGQPATLSVSATGTEPLSYQWYEGITGATTLPIGGATTSTWTTPALAESKQYWVRVSNAYGSRNSNAALLTVIPPVGRPFDLHVRATGGGLVTFAWTAGAGQHPATNFMLEGGISGSDGVLAQITTGGPTPVMTVAVPNGRFWARVRAVAGASTGEPSERVDICVNAGCPALSPENLLGAGNGHDLVLAWRTPLENGWPDAVRLQVTGAATLSLDLPGTAQTFTYNGVLPGNYNFAVVACRSAACSAPSNPVALGFPAACSGPPQAPANFVATKADSTISLNWDLPAAGSAPSYFQVQVTGAYVGNVTVTTRALSGTVGPGTYTIALQAANACGASAPTAPVVVTIP